MLKPQAKEQLTQKLTQCYLSFRRGEEGMAAMMIQEMYQIMNENSLALSHDQIFGDALGRGDHLFCADIVEHFWLPSIKEYNG